MVYPGTIKNLLPSSGTAKQVSNFLQLETMKKRGMDLAPLKAGKALGGLAPLSTTKKSSPSKKKKKKSKKKQHKAVAADVSYTDNIIANTVKALSSEEEPAVVLEPIPPIDVGSDSSDYDYNFSDDEAPPATTTPVAISSPKTTIATTTSTTTTIPRPHKADTTTTTTAGTTVHVSRRGSVNIVQNTSPTDEFQETKRQETKTNTDTNINTSNTSITSNSSNSSTRSRSFKATSHKKTKSARSASSTRSKPIHEISKLSSDIRTRLSALDSAENGHVTLADACLGDYGCRAVAERLSSSSVTSLDLRGNQIRADGAVALAAALSTNRSLRTLSLEWNSLGLFPEGFRAMASMLAQPTSSLTSIDMRNNRLTADAGTALASALRTNRSLNTIDLRWNALGELGTRSLSSAMESNDTVTALHMSGNSASESTLKILKKHIERNRATHGITNNTASLHNSYNTETKINNTNKGNSKREEDVPTTPLDPESLEGATSIIQTLERALRLQRIETLNVSKKLESEIVAHTRAREGANVNSTTLISEKERYEMKLLESKNEIDRHIRERSILIEENNQKVETINVASSALVRTNYDLEAKLRSLNETLSIAREEVRQNKVKAADLSDRCAELTRTITSMSTEMSSMKTMHEKSLEDTRRLYETTSQEIRTNSDSVVAMSEKRREKTNESNIRLQAEIDSMKANVLKIEMEHQSKLDQMEIRIREEVQSSSSGVMQQLETELRAASTARDVVLARRETDAINNKKDRDRTLKQVEQLQKLLEESRVSTIENSKKHALVQDVVSGHQKQVDESLNEIERLKNEITKLQNERTSYLKKSENNVKRIEERNELERMRWKKDMDDKDKRIKNLEKACRERDAEKIQRIANTTMTIDELQGSLNYALRKCFTDARYKVQAPVTVPHNNASSSDSDGNGSSSIGQKLSQSGGSSKKNKHKKKSSPRSSPRNKNTVITARPYSSIKNEDGDAYADESHSDEIIVMEDNSDDAFMSGDENVSIEF